MVLASLSCGWRGLGFALAFLAEHPRDGSYPCSPEEKIQDLYLFLGSCLRPDIVQ